MKPFYIVCFIAMTGCSTLRPVNQLTYCPVVPAVCSNDGLLMKEASPVGWDNVTNRVLLLQNALDCDYDTDKLIDRSECND